MAAGTLSQAGYFMGEQLWPAQAGNPRGFFEDREVNAINEDILAPVTPAKPKWPAVPWAPLRVLGAHRPGKGQRWLADVPVKREIPATSAIESRIRCLTAREPYCFKDPRFSYTLPVWRPFLKSTGFVCVFRYPAVTAHSILTECERADHLKGLNMSFRRALRVWELMYSHILQKHASDGEWLFLHYDQILRGDGLDRLHRFLGVVVDCSFPDSALRRSSGDGEVPAKVRWQYQQLCELAGYNDPEYQL
jgi:hypothetical protein